VSAEHRPYLAHLKNGDVDSVLSERDAVQALLDSRGWALLNELLDDVHENAVTRLLLTHAGSEGRVFDQAEYARLVGFLSGLQQFRWAAEAFIEHAERVRRREG
jgi:hypothetical protein